MSDIEEMAKEWGRACALGDHRAARAIALEMVAHARTLDTTSLPEMGDRLERALAGGRLDEAMTLITAMATTAAVIDSRTHDVFGAGFLTSRGEVTRALLAAGY